MSTDQEAMLDEQHGEGRIETWKPSITISIVWTILSTLLTIGTVGGFLLLYTLLTGSDGDVGRGLADVDRSTPGEVSVSLNSLGLLMILAVGVGILLVHEAVHAAAFRYYGGRPEFGATLVNKILPVLYCTAPGYRFTRGQFAVVILAPAVVITAVGVILMPFTNLGMWLVVPLAINFGGAVGDFWFAGMLLTKEPGTLIEDLRDGLRFHYPSPA